jgi:hypothetical protein
MRKFEFEEYGRAYVPISIKPLDEITLSEVRFKVDTATGDKINAGYIQLPLINILGYEGKNWAFQVIMDEKQDFRNLLGRDLLAGFNYQFNNDEHSFAISRTKKFTPLYKFLPRQEINEITK